MVAIHFLIIIKLGGVNIKKKKSSKPYLASDNSEVSEQKDKHKMLEADERSLWAADMSLWAIYNFLVPCALFGFYPYEYPISSPVNHFNNKLENNKIDKL